MDIERKKRLKEKIEVAKKRLGNIEETLPEFEKETLKLACYKAFQEVVETITDITAMILINNNKSIEDDYSNIERIKDFIDLNEKDVKIIKEANGLRNRIVHKYNTTDDEIAKESINNLLPELERIINKFESYLK